MKVKRLVASVATAMLLSLPALAAPQNDSSFSALQGVEAQALSVDEMQAIQGLISATNIAELTFAIANDPNLSDGAKKLLLAFWGELAKLDGTKFEFLADRFFLFLKPRYPNICGLNADFCSGPFPGTL
jgi:hypothetical protein